MEEERELFTETMHCTSQTHCPTCRDKENGAKWRRSLLSLYLLPNDNDPEFECPYGKAWVHTEPKQPCSHCKRQPKEQPNQKTGCSKCKRNREKALT